MCEEAWLRWWKVFVWVSVFVPVSVHRLGLEVRMSCHRLGPPGTTHFSLTGSHICLRGS